MILNEILLHRKSFISLHLSIKAYLCLILK
nr:MAG TPA: hypothetical protein [Caudoviricetes sp.]